MNKQVKKKARWEIEIEIKRGQIIDKLSMIPFR